MSALQWLLAFLLLGSCAAQTRNNSISLMKDMLRDYDRKHRPVMNQSSPMIVNVTFQIVALHGFEEVSGTLSLLTIILIEWVDEVINWDPSSYGGITSQLYAIEDVWYPLIVQASPSEKFTDLREDWMPLRIDHEGNVVFELGLVVKSTCEVDVTYYPFDTQRCHIWFTRWAMHSAEMRLNAPVPFAYDTFYTENGEWTLVRNSTSVIDGLNGGVLDLQIEFQRKPLFAVVNTILPMVLMSILNLMVFLLPPESGERVSFTMTVLLANAVFLTLVAESLPSTSEPMSLLAFFLIVGLSISAAICVATILNLRVYYRQECRPLSSLQRRFVDFARCKCNITTATPTETNTINRGDLDNNLDDEPVAEQLETIEVNWQTYALAIDKVLFVVFGTAMLCNTVVFLLILIVNKGASSTTYRGIG